MTLKEQVHKLHELAVEAQKTIQPESFWADVEVVCNTALAAAFHLSETLPEDRSGVLEFAAGKFLNRWDGRE